MTRNLYLGVDIMRPLEALAALPPDATDQQKLVTLARATDTARDIVDQTDFGTRSKLLAQEIAAAKPDLVGLQEVAMWRSGPLDLINVAVPDATTVDYDWLRMLRKELKAEGVPYRPVSVNWLSDVEAPSFSETPASPDARDVRLTMRDVILKRVGSGIKVLRHQERVYKDGLVVEISGKKLDFRRGYQWADVERAGKRFRFINTHLEAFSSDMAYKQMQQMLEGPGTHRRTTIIACDCNSDPLNQSVKTQLNPPDTLPHSEPYWLATGQHEFFDTWLQWKPARFGWTSGLNETVDEAPDPATGKGSFTHRIDLILAKKGDGSPLRVVGGQVTGDEAADRDPTTGLWPSDHAGVVMRLRGL
jgi:endonuclease/exonuclease/phosphatase family metal-dependent hydrolase